VVSPKVTVPASRRLGLFLSSATRVGGRAKPRTTTAFLAVLVFSARPPARLRIPLLIVDEVGYIPFDPEAAALLFALIPSRYERRSLIVSSNKTFSDWAEIFGDPVAVAAMVDRLVHQAEVLVLKGESYRLRGKREEVLTAEKER
jgi:hypothetical protein